MNGDYIVIIRKPLNSSSPKLATSKLRTKFRPVLTAVQIKHILTLAKNEVPLSDESLSLISSLAPFLCKIETGAVQDAYTTLPKKDITSLEALGALPPYKVPTTLQSTINMELAKEEIWKAAYVKYATDSASCTVEEIQNAQEHMYLNDLMTPKEMAKFEAPNT